METQRPPTTSVPARPRPARGGHQDLFFSASSAAGLPDLVRGEGIHVWDRAGRRYVDVAAGAFLATLGHGNARVLAALAEQGRTLSFACTRNARHDANLALSEKLSGLAGPGFERVHLCSSGSEAVETAIQLCRQRAVALGEPERSIVISLEPSYHGSTFATMAYTGDARTHAVYGPMLPPFELIPAPLTYRSPSPAAASDASIAALRDVLERVGAARVLAVLIEPIGGQASGANVPAPAFARELRRICSASGILLVFDEVVTAFRTGRLLAAHRDPAALPDVAVLAKGIGAGYAPLGAVLASARLVDDLADRSGFDLAHSSNAAPLSCAVGAAVLDEVVGRDLMGNAVRTGAILRAGLERIAARSPIVSDVRGDGMLLATELVRDKESALPFGPEVDPALVVRRHAADHGLLLYARRMNSGRFGDWILVTPPLVIDEGEAEELIDRLEEAIADAARELLG